MKRKVCDDMDILVGSLSQLNMDNLRVIDTQNPWDVLQSNYVKLNSLHQLIRSNGKQPGNGKTFNLMQRLVVFMENVDKHTQHYLREINFHDPTSGFRIEAELIKSLLESSLNEHNPLKKLRITLKTYQVLAFIVQQPYQVAVDDDFVNMFKKIKV